MPGKTIIQFRRDTAANWASVNPVLHDSELGVETDTGKAKLGTGLDFWNFLPYWQPSGPDTDNFVTSVNTHTGAVTLTASDVGADTSGAAAAAQTAAQSFATSAVSSEATTARAAEGLALQKASNLADLANAATARANLGLSSAATQPSSAFDAAGAAAAEQTRAMAAEALAASTDYFATQAVTNGETVLPRINIGTGSALVSGRVHFSYWTASKTETISNISGLVASTGAAATPTYCAMGVYSVAVNGNLTLAGACANDTTMFATAFGQYTRAILTPFTKVAGQRYAFAYLVVSATTMPNLLGYNGTLAFTGSAPAIASALTGQSVLPASVASASLANISSMYTGLITP